MTSNSRMLTGVFLSLLVHAFAFAKWESDFTFNNSIKASDNISKHITVKLVKSLVPVTKKPLIKTRKLIPEKPKPIIPTKTSITKNKPIVKQPKVTQTKKEIAVKSLDRETTKAVDASPPSLDTTVKTQQDIKVINKKEKEAYIQLLLAHIEEYKFYPGAARRRAIEGKLDVTFLLNESGGHYQLKINGGKSVLQRAVRQALEDAQPFPKPPSSLLSDQAIAFSMYYQLSDLN